MGGKKKTRAPEPPEQDGRSARGHLLPSQSRVLMSAEELKDETVQNAERPGVRREERGEDDLVNEDAFFYEEGGARSFVEARTEAGDDFLSIDLHDW